MSLFWFDNLARRAIDPALDAAMHEVEGLGNPDYVVSIDLNRAASRTQCRLSITSTHATKPREIGDMVISEGPNDTVNVKHSFAWVDNGKPSLIATIAATDVSQAEITLLAREFVDEYFQRIAEASEKIV